MLVQQMCPIYAPLNWNMKFLMNLSISKRREGKKGMTFKKFIKVIGMAGDGII